MDTSEKKNLQKQINRKEKKLFKLKKDLDDLWTKENFEGLSECDSTKKRKMQVEFESKRKEIDQLKKSCSKDTMEAEAVQTNKSVGATA